MKILLYFMLPLLFLGTAHAATLFTEPFEDTNFVSRGWYDSPTGSIDNSNFAPGIGSTASFVCNFLAGGSGCTGGNPARHKFTPTNSVYISYWTKHSASFLGSGQTFHPHEFYLLTTRNGDYDGLSFDYLTAYIEENWRADGGHARVAIQDGQMIDQTKINVDLQGITETRAVSACNGIGNTGGDSGNGTGPSCYLGGSPTLTSYWNAYVWDSPSAVYTTENKQDWHFVEAYLQLNSISGGIGQKDGVIWYKVDGVTLINVTNAIMRTGASPKMQFNQLIIGNYIGSGAPVAQTFWIDQLTVATSPPSQNTSPSPPTNLQVR